jgi:Tfp pilus assembly protein PilF
LQQAEGLLQQGRLDEAKNLVDQQLALNPSSVDAYNMLGIIDTGKKDYAGALEAFHHALTLAPNSATAHNNLGNLYVSQQELELAEKEFNKVLALSPPPSKFSSTLCAPTFRRESPSMRSTPPAPYRQRTRPM